MEDFYETATEDAKRFGDLARQAVADGFTAFKSMAVPPTMPLEGLAADPHGRGVRRARCARRWARRSTSWSIATPGRRRAWALQFAKALEPYGLYWFEEPCWPESIDGLAADQQRR